MIRWLVGLSALPVTAYGVWLLLSRQDSEQVVDAGTWLVSGVVAHDLLISGLAIIGGLAVALMPTPSRAPAAVALVVLGSLTLVAFPVLGGFGEIADNPTHLDRPYLTAWVTLVAASAVAVLVASVVRSRKKER